MQISYFYIFLADKDYYRHHHAQKKLIQKIWLGSIMTRN